MSARLNPDINDGIQPANAAAVNELLDDIEAVTSIANYSIFAAGAFSTAGGDANESISAPGATSSDLAFCQLQTKGSTPRTILTAKSKTDGIDVVLSGDPSTDHVIVWQVLRLVS